MRLRTKNDHTLASSCEFNLHSLNEIIVYYEDDVDSDLISNYDCYIKATGEWKDLNEAFRDHDVITDNYNTMFFEPRTPEDRERGFEL